MNIELSLSDEIKFFIACVIGAGVRTLRSNGERFTWRLALRKAGDVVSGVAVAYYTGPAIISHLGWTDPAFANAMGFIIGYLAMELCGFAITVLTEIVPGIARWWLALRASTITGPARGNPPNGDAP